MNPLEREPEAGKRPEQPREGRKPAWENKEDPASCKETPLRILPGTLPSIRLFRRPLFLWGGRA